MSLSKLARQQLYGTYLGPYEAAVNATLVSMAKEHIMARIWACDHTVWKPEPAEISNRLGWLHIAEAIEEDVPRLATFANAVRAEGFTHVLLLGMGGSSLAPEVLRKTFGVKAGYPDLAVLDSTDPDAILAQAKDLDLKRTLFVVSTKSGETAETISLFKFFCDQVLQTVGEKEASRHFVAITDPGTELADLAAEYRFRDRFLNDPNIGGRYSALSYVGLVPAALIGLDIRLLLERARAGARSAGPDVAVGDNLAAWLGAILGTLALKGRDKLTLVISPSIVSFGDWVEQLVAESTGKESKGILPVVGEPMGSPSAYGEDRLFVHLCLDGEPVYDEAIQTLASAGHPVVTLHLRDRYDLGEQFFLWEMATAVAGHLLGINPFDQPDVEAAKSLAREMIAAYLGKGTLPGEKPNLEMEGIAIYIYDTFRAETLREALEAFLAQANLSIPGRSYIALQAYIQPTRASDAALLRLRTCLRERYRLATTVGYGPRFLHSTGQLHKGDGGHGLFIQFTGDASRDVSIPEKAGQPSASITFGILKAAQAQGDLQALLRRRRRVIRFHLGKDVVGALERIAKALSMTGGSLDG